MSAMPPDFPDEKQFARHSGIRRHPSSPVRWAATIVTIGVVSCTWINRNKPVPPHTDARVAHQTVVAEPADNHAEEVRVALQEQRAAVEEIRSLRQEVRQAVEEARGARQALAREKQRAASVGQRGRRMQAVSSPDAVLEGLVFACIHDEDGTTIDGGTEGTWLIPGQHVEVGTVRLAAKQRDGRWRISFEEDTRSYPATKLK